MELPQGFSRRGTGVMLFWLTTMLVVIADQATKAGVRYLMELGDSPRPLIPGLFDLVRVENTGAAFSLGQGSSWLFVCCALLVAAVACVSVWRNDFPLPFVVALGCVTGGGIGNMIDRLVSGSVTDFIAATFVSFPVFNVADIFVTCGVAASLVLYLRWERSQEAPAGRGEEHAHA